MAIQVSTLYTDVLAELGIGENTTNNTLFVRSVNRALGELSIKADLATRYSNVSSTTDTISMDSALEYVVATGSTYWMMRAAAVQADPRVAKAKFKETERMWKDAIGDHWSEHWNGLQATHDNDIIALGHCDTQ